LFVVVKVLVVVGSLINLCALFLSLVVIILLLPLCLATTATTTPSTATTTTTATIVATTKLHHAVAETSNRLCYRQVQCGCVVAVVRGLLKVSVTFRVGRILTIKIKKECNVEIKER